MPTRWTLSRKKLPPLTRVREFRRLLVQLSRMETADVALDDLRERVPQICDGETLWSAMAARILTDIGVELGESAPAADLAESLHCALADHLHTHIIGDGVLVGDGACRQGVGV